MNILLVDDEHESRRCVADFLKELGHEVTECADGNTALQAFQIKSFHLVLTDIRMPGMSGLELLSRIRGLPNDLNTQTVVFTGYGDLQTAVDALRAGAYDYLLKPINVEELVQVTDRVAELQALKSENQMLSTRFADAVNAATEETRQELYRFKKAYYQTVGPGRTGIFSETMKNIFEQAVKIHADRSLAVLIEGETGTGKEAVARCIHYGKDVVTTPFVDLNCAAIASNMFESELFGYEAGAFTGGLPKGKKGKLDLATGGTLFLDEVTEIPVDLQAKLLRVIQEKEFYRVGGLKKIKLDVRFICATNANIEEKVSRGEFREDLYYRLSTGRIYLPPLRDRREEILPLAEMFLTDFCREKGKELKTIGKEAADVLISYNWPGNVRELKNLMEWLVLMSDDRQIRPAHIHSLQKTRVNKLNGEMTPNFIDCDNFSLPPGGLPIEQYVNNIIRKALQAHHGNKTETAKYLGMSRRSLYSRLKNI